jgi:hypothetical protein
LFINLSVNGGVFLRQGLLLLILVRGLRCVTLPGEVFIL